MRLAYCNVLNFHVVSSKLPDFHAEPIHISFDLIIIYVSNYN
jgi:hypothetical protein